jgi:hypothetical protein
MNINTVKEAQSLLESLRLYWQLQHEEINKKWDIVNGNMTFNVPDDFEKHVPPTAVDIIEDATSYIDGLKLYIEVPSEKNTMREERRSGILTEWCNERIMPRILDSDYISPLRQFTKDLLVTGVACLKAPLYDEEMWEKTAPNQGEGESDEDYKSRKADWKFDRDQKFPIKLINVDFRNIFPDPTYPAKYAIESYRRKCIDIQALWKDFDPKAYGWDTLTEVDWNEYWDYEKRIFWVSLGGNSYAVPEAGVTEEVVKHGYPYLPYIIRYSGLGKRGASVKPDEMTVGILDHAIYSLKAEARLKTAIDAVTQLSAWQNLMYDAEKAPKGGLVLSFAPATANPVPKDINLRPMNTPTVTKDTYEYLGVVMREIQRHTFPDSFGGMRTTGVTAGYHEEGLIGQAKQKLVAFMRPIASAWEELFGNILRMVDNCVEGDIYAVSKAQVKGRYTVKAKWDTFTPEEKDRRIQLGMALEGKLSRRTLMRDYYGVDNPDAEFDQMAVEAGMASPQVQQKIVEEAMKGWGMSVTEQEDEEKQRLLNVQGQPQPEPSQQIQMNTENVQNITTEAPQGVPATTANAWRERTQQPFPLNAEGRMVGVRGMRRGSPMPQGLNTIEEQEGF